MFTACVQDKRIPQPLASNYNPKPLTSPAIHYCFDSIGHQSGAKPYLLGGTCVCTPTAAVLADYQKHGYFVGLNLDDLLARYKQLKIETALDHQHCNNLCRWGPHVLKGGHCMVPPTPGTRNYEEILSGHIPGGVKPVPTIPAE